MNFKIKKHIALFNLICIVGLMYNNIFNIHQHQIYGYIISHAHPYSKDCDNKPIKNHNHTRNGLLIISSINNLFYFILLSTFVYNFKNINSTYVFNKYQINSTLQNFQYFFNLRAPPR